jgi:hypothetical protein
MSIGWNAAAKNARMNSGLSQIDANASPATMEIGTAAMATVLVVITLSKPSFTLATDTLTLAGVPKSANAAATGTAANARIKDGGGNIVVQNLTVGTTGSDINLNSTSITVGQQVTVNSFTMQHSA